MLTRRILAAVSLACCIALAKADYSDGVIKIGVLTDLSGPYANSTGSGSVLAARMAVEDFGAAEKGMKVEVVSGDHKNKADIGSAIARQWYDQDKVDVIVDVPASAVALAVNEITREKKKALLVSSAVTSDLTGKACSPNTIHWTIDTWAIANGTGSLIVLLGGKTWSFVTLDNPFGHAMTADTEAAVTEAGGRVIERVAHPFSAPDMGPYLRKAIATDAKIIGLANAGGDTINAIKIGSELGVGKSGRQFAGLLVTESDVHTVGLEKAQGMLLTTAFYWDLNPKTRVWSRRFMADQKRMPTMGQAGVYSAVLHYLKSVEALQSDDGTRVIAKMKQMQTYDPLFGYGTIRQDGRKVHNLYLFEVKKPSESRMAWDYYKLRGIVPADSAFRPRKVGGCPLIKST
jgi:branched-chain amino acid transport system substrate-binding protein